MKMDGNHDWNHRPGGVGSLCRRCGAMLFAGYDCYLYQPGFGQETFKVRKGEPIPACPTITESEK